MCGRLWKLSEVMTSLSHVARGNGQIQWPWTDASADLTILCLSWGHKANANTPSWPHKHSHISAGQCPCVCVFVGRPYRIPEVHLSLICALASFQFSCGHLFSMVRPSIHHPLTGSLLKRSSLKKALQRFT